MEARLCELEMEQKQTVQKDRVAMSWFTLWHSEHTTLKERMLESIPGIDEMVQYVINVMKDVVGLMEDLYTDA